MDPEWDPKPVPINNGVDGKISIPLLLLGYTPTDESEDADWLDAMMNDNYASFMMITGYRTPTPCSRCGKCDLRVVETHYEDSECETTVRLRVMCQNDEPKPTLRLNILFAELRKINNTIYPIERVNAMNASSGTPR